MKEIDGRPEQVRKIGFEAGFAQGGDKGVEDVGDGGRDDAAFG